MASSKKCWTGVHIVAARTKPFKLILELNGSVFKMKCAMFGRYCPAYDSPVMYLRVDGAVRQCRTPYRYRTACGESAWRS